MTPHILINQYLVKFGQDNFLEAIVIHFLSNSGKVLCQHTNIQTKIKLGNIVAEGERGVRNGGLGYVANSAS